MHMRARARMWVVYGIPVRGTWYALCMAMYKVFPQSADEYEYAFICTYRACTLGEGW